MKLGTQTGSLVNHIYSNTKNKMPNIGDGATLLMWSDRKPCTVVSIEKNIITVQEDTVKHLGDDNKEFTRNFDGQMHIYRLEKDGSLVQVTMNYQTGRYNKIEGAGLRLGKREHYFDISF